MLRSHRTCFDVSSQNNGKKVFQFQVSNREPCFIICSNQATEMLCLLWLAISYLCVLAEVCASTTKSRKLHKVHNNTLPICILYNYYIDREILSSKYFCMHKSFQHIHKYRFIYNFYRSNMNKPWSKLDLYLVVTMVTMFIATFGPCFPCYEGECSEIDITGIATACQKR